MRCWCCSLVESENTFEVELRRPDHRKIGEQRLIDWLAVIVSIVLPIVVGLGGWFGQRIIGRIDVTEQRVTEMASKASERDSKQDARLYNLERTSLTREDLREVLESSLQRAIGPITEELRAINSGHQETRERIIRLEASTGRSD